MPGPVSWNDVVDAARARWQASTLPGTSWQRDLPAALARVAHDWALEPVGMFTGGVGVPVVDVLSDGVPAVLKLGPPDELNHQAAVMRADAGRSHARVLAHDETAAALLLERLGAPVGEVVEEPMAQYALIADTLHRWWQIPLELGSDAGSKAQGLVGILDVQGARHCQEWGPALAAARAVALELAGTERTEVVCHGDPHPWNLLQHPADGGWRFVDPDGFRGERAYDLGVVIRGESELVIRLEAERPGSGLAFVRRSAAALAEHTGVDAERIWQWAFIERVTTGLFCRMLGYDAEGRHHLDAATVLCADRR